MVCGERESVQVRLRELPSGACKHGKRTIKCGNRLTSGAKCVTVPLKFKAWPQSTKSTN